MDHVLGRRADDQITEASLTVTADDDEIVPALACVPRDVDVRRPVAQARCDGYVPPPDAPQAGRLPLGT
jgi:hypothetical protein